MDVKEIAPYIDRILLIETTHEPDSSWSTGIPAERCDGIPALTQEIVSASDQRFLVITDNEGIAALVAALNLNVKKKSVLMLGDRLTVSDDAAAQIREESSQIVDYSGRCYTVEKKLTKDFLLLSGGRYAVASHSFVTDSTMQKVTSRSGEFSGCLLPDSWRYEGQLEELLDGGDIEKRLSLADLAVKEMGEAQRQNIRLKADEDVPVMETDGQRRILFRQDRNGTDSGAGLAAIVFHAAVGVSVKKHRRQEVVCTVIRAVADAPVRYPGYLLEDIEDSLIRQREITPAKWANTLERLRLERRPDGRFFANR